MTWVLWFVGGVFAVGLLQTIIKLAVISALEDVSALSLAEVQRTRIAIERAEEVLKRMDARNERLARQVERN